MLKLIYGIEKTNSFRPTPWGINTDNFIKFYGSGSGYKIMQAIHPSLSLLFENDKDKQLSRQSRLYFQKQAEDVGKAILKFITIRDIKE